MRVVLSDDSRGNLGTKAFRVFILSHYMQVKDTGEFSIETDSTILKEVPIEPL